MKERVFSSPESVRGSEFSWSVIARNLSAQKIIEQALAGRGHVETPPTREAWAALSMKFLIARSGVQAFHEKGVDRRVARGQLRRMKIPT